MKTKVTEEICREYCKLNRIDPDEVAMPDWDCADRVWKKIEIALIKKFYDLDFYMECREEQFRKMASDYIRTFADENMKDMEKKNETD